MFFWEITFLLALILVNGFFAMSELAIVSSRRALLKQRADAGSRGAAAALQLSDEPTRFLSTVQIGITLIGILAGAISGATLAEEFGAILDEVSWLRGHGEAVAFAIVVVIMTYLSLVIGELVPKRVAMTHAESIAVVVAPVLRAISRGTGPVVALLQISTSLVLRLLGIREASTRRVTDEEISAVLAEGTEQGVIKAVEREMIEEVLSLEDRPVRSMMTHRTGIEWLDVSASNAEIREQVVRGGYGRYLVCDGSVDNVVGYVRTRELIDALLMDQKIDLAALAREPLTVPPSTKALALLAHFKTARPHLAIVVDEYGDLMGLITPTDILETIAGDLAGDHLGSQSQIVRREDGSYLVDAHVDIDELEAHTGAGGLVTAERFTTLARFVLEQLGRIPAVGETFVAYGWRFEIVDMDGNRIDKVIVKPPDSRSRRL